MNDIHSLAHSKWNCKYHIVFAPKYRRKTMFGVKGREIGAILRELCKWKGVNIIEAEICPDHVHMLVEIPPKMSVSGFVGYLKGKSSLMIYEQWGNLKFKYRNREFWCKGYYVDTVGKNTQKIRQKHRMLAVVRHIRAANVHRHKTVASNSGHNIHPDPDFCRARSIFVMPPDCYLVH